MGVWDLGPASEDYCYSDMHLYELCYSILTDCGTNNCKLLVVD